MKKFLSATLASIPLLFPFAGCAEADAGSRIPEDICGAKIVFLGESSHGSGSSIEVKAEIAERLLRSCGFNQVAFESQTYDFPSLIPPSIQSKELRNAVGGLWSTASESDSLFERLTSLANERKVRLVGIDGQLGSSSSMYAKAQLARDLTLGMPSSRIRFCSQALNRLTNWTFTEDDPKDIEFDQELRACAKEAHAVSDRRNDQHQKHLARNLSEYLDFSSGDYLNDRDRLLAENLREYSESDRRTIVWTANVHAAKRMFSGRRPLASYFSGDSGVKSIVVTAGSGEFCMYPCKTPSSVITSSPNSLESMVLDQSRENQLIDLRREFSGSIIPSKILGYSKETTAEWSSLFDYVVVLRREHAATHVRAPEPEN